MVISRCSMFVIVSLLVFGAGCCSSAPVGPKTTPVSGKVLYKNLPVEGATVSFLGDGTTRAAMAITDSLGQFVLTTTRSGDGAVPGVHKITISKIIAPLTKSASEPMSMEAAAKAVNVPPAQPLSMLPAKYQSALSSGLSQTVKAKEKNEFTFDLKD